MPTKENRLLQGCPLYNTKPENMPATLTTAIHTAEDLRNLKELGLLPSLDDMSAWEFTCLDAAERASRTIQNEKIIESSKKAQQDKTNHIPLSPRQPKGDTDALTW